MNRRYEVVEVKSCGEQIIGLTVRAPELAGACMPGQFAHIACGGGIQSILRRPLSIADVEGERVSFLFQVKGEGTQWLAARRPGDFVEIMAPMGEGVFHLPTSGHIFLTAGGIGIAPLIFAARRLAENGVSTTLLYGAASAAGLSGLNAFASLGVTVRTATEDGSAGVRGYVTELLRQELLQGDPSRVFACGPHGMLKAVAAMGQAAGIPVEVSMEQLMACGVGACRGCVVRVRRNGKETYENVCTQGPVFAGTEVVFDE